MNKRKLLWISGCLFLVLVIVLSIANRAGQKNGDQGVVGQPQTEQPSGSFGGVEDPSTAPDPAGNEGDGSSHGPKSIKASSKDAVISAIEAVGGLSVAQLLPPELLRESVNNLAVPESRTVLIELLGPNGRNLATAWGYDSTQDALINSEYRVGTQKYRVDEFDASAGTATVSLYTVTHFVTRSVTSVNQLLWLATDSPRINVVKMRWVNDRWLFVERSDPKPGQAPDFTDKDVGLSFNQVVNRYKPFLEKGGYVNHG